MKPLPTADVTAGLLILLSGISCFCPLLFGSLVDHGDSSFRQNLASQSNRDLAVAAVALSAPIFIEIALKVVGSFSVDRKSAKVEKHMRKALLSSMELFLLLLGILSCQVTAFLPSDSPNLVNTFYCAKRCRSVLTICAITVSCCRYDARYWSVRSTIATVLTVAFSNAVASMHDNLPVLHEIKEIKIISAVIFYIGASIFFVNAFRWFLPIGPILLRRIKLDCRSQLDCVSGEKDAVSIGYHLYPLLYVVTTSLTSAFLTIMNRAFPHWNTVGPNSIFYHNLLITVYLFLLIYISDKMMKYEIIQGLCALIESKKMYVRYISHELRTPLNTAFLGLKIVCDDLKTRAESANSENLETLLDVQSACNIGVEILNDLLCFDKLESGILELHKHDVTVIPFIDVCVKLFASQAREAGVTVTYIASPPVPLNTDFSTSATATTPSHATGLLDDDFVHMDKFKMDQVLRNLISNALKFTPRGGSVTVCATFVADDGCRGLPWPARPVPLGDAPRSGCLPSRLWSLLTCWSKYLISVFTFHHRHNRVHVSNDGHLNTVGLGLAHRCRRQSMQADEAVSLCQEDASSYDYHRRMILLAGDSILDNGHIDIAAMQDVETGCVGDSASAAADAPNKLLCDARSGGADGLVTNGKLRIVVTDTGAGISAANQLLLFKEIVQFNPEVLQAGGGSGLGLWITSSIVKMHGGSISVHSAGLGKGSSFTVEIDMHRLISAPHPSLVHQSLFAVRHSDDVEEWSSSEEKSSPRTCSEILKPGRKVGNESRSSLTSMSLAMNAAHLPIENMDAVITSPNPTSLQAILVVDDSTLNRKLLCKLLCSAGYTCEEASDGLIAVEMVKTRISDWAGPREEYHAILMDFVMPNMDGPTATKAIRHLGHRGPIFGVTGNALDSDVNYFVRSGANGVLAKPFDFAAFKELLHPATT